MKRLLLLSLLLSSLSALPSSVAAEGRKFADGARGKAASALTATCTSKGQTRTSVAGEPFNTTTVDFVATSGFDPVPILSTTVDVSGGGESCLVAHFSAMPTASSSSVDEYVLFQVTVDGVPMSGHFPEPFLIPNPAVAVTPDLDTEMSAYNFFATVTGGSHTVEVHFAGCCNGGGATVFAPVLTLEYR
jgi:hypothetical protein